MPEMAAPVTNGDAGSWKANHDNINNNVSRGSASSNGHAATNDNGIEVKEDATDSGVSSPSKLLEAGSSAWIDAALVAEALGEDAASVSDIEVKPAVADGDNYCSCMWRVRARAGGRPVRLIVKAPPKGELMQDFVNKLGFFTKEANMLTETLPAMQAIGLARCGPDHILAKPLGPAALPSAVPGVLIMEDLCVDGFRNKERQGQLDLRHCEMALEILARMHALSIALHREQPSSMDSYSEGLYVRGGEDNPGKMHAEIQLKRFAEAVEVWEGTKGKGYGEKLERLATAIFDQMCDAVTPSEHGVNVLNHGDFWINNMMYLYDDGDEASEHPKDIRLVDLQLVRFSSAVLDLQYFITTSAREQLRLNELDVLLGHYRDCFNEYVEALGIDDARWPSLEALRADYLAKSVFGFTAMYCVLCAVVAQPEDRLQLEKLSKENMMEADIATRAWRGKIFQQLLPGLLDHYVDVGVLR